MGTIAPYKLPIESGKCYVHLNMARYVLSNSKLFGLLPKVCSQEHSKVSFQPLKKI